MIEQKTKLQIMREERELTIKEAALLAIRIPPINPIIPEPIVHKSFCEALIMHERVGVRRISDSRLYRVAQVYGCSVDELREDK
ncbi:hypothetical protein [Lactococcus petauri]|uniref:hypothetical protein n=1 Tax=Lactococcus petauri TaxID=1940789 RepID=UPI00254D9E7D|nr:hypothetical protein [Lactococcus petauri]